MLNLNIQEKPTYLYYNIKKDVAELCVSGRRLGLDSEMAKKAAFSRKVTPVLSSEYVDLSKYFTPSQMRYFRPTENVSELLKKRSDSNLTRTKKTVYEYAVCNPWEYFFTFTINGKKWSRTYIKECRSYISEVLNRRGISYFMVAEFHADNSFHFHGLMTGASEHLVPFDLKDTLPYYIIKKLRKGFPVYDLPCISENVGYVTVEPVKNHDAVARYITKYITKDFKRMSSCMNMNLFSHTQGLACGTRGVIVVHHWKADTFDGFIENANGTLSYYDMCYEELKAFLEYGFGRFENDPLSGYFDKLEDMEDDLFEEKEVPDPGCKFFG